MDNTMYDVSQLKRMAFSMLEFGRVSKVHDNGNLVKATIKKGGDDFETDYMPVVTDYRKGDDRYRPFSLTEQVVIFNPNGDFVGAIVLGTLRLGDVDVVDQVPTMDFGDGTKVIYNRETKELKLSIASDVKLVIEGASNLNVSAKNITIKSDEKMEIKSGGATGKDIFKVLVDLLSAFEKFQATLITPPQSGVMNPGLLTAITTAKTDLEAFKGGPV